jgi:Spy/CpxP family protein refolding chaperone
MKMKKLLVLSLAACMFTLATSAQTERQTETKPRAERHKGNHEKAKMMKDLNLSKEQQAQMKANHKEMKTKRDALKAQDNITVKEMRERKAALKAEQDGKMAAMLTPEQKVKMDEMKKQKKAEKKPRSPKMEARENQPTAE